MQTVSTTWETIASSSDFITETKAVIGGVEYTEISAPVIDKALCKSTIEVGNTIAASLTFSIRTDDVFERGAAVEIKERLWDAARTTATEWITAGTFYISKRSADYSSRLVSLTCYDAMLKASAPFTWGDDKDLGVWPQKMEDVAAYIAERMGVAMDSRTVLKTGDAYMVEFAPDVAEPDIQLTKVLGYIGAVNGGNWIITPEGTLRLVRLEELGGQVEATPVHAILTQLTTSKTITITKIRISTQYETYEAGTDDGYTLDIGINPYASQAICDALHNQLNGLVYLPFEADDAIYNPAVELGDRVKYKEIFEGAIVSEKLSLKVAARGEISAPANTEYEEEYPYKNPAQSAYQMSVAAKQSADAAQESVDNLEIGGRNYFRITPKAYDPGLYNAYDLYITEPLAAGQTYTLQLWDVYVSNDGKTEDQLGVNVFYCGGSVMLGAWIGTEYFQDGFADRLTLTFTPSTEDVNHQDVISEPAKFIRLYNSVPRVDAEMHMSVGGWKLEKGDHGTDWTLSPEDVQDSFNELQPELIVGTHGTTATAAWTGTSTVLTEIKEGTRIQYKLSSKGAPDVTLNLTLKGGATTGAKPVYFLGNTRLGTQYDADAVINLIYDGSVWRVLNPYTNSDTVGTYAGPVVAGANGVKSRSLVMRHTNDKWVSLTTTSGTDTTKERYIGKLIMDQVLYMDSDSDYASGETTGVCYDALALDLRYSTNCGNTLIAGKPVYLVGELRTDNYFYLDAVWWTQAEPTTVDGKTYIYLGLAYSETSIFLVSENTPFRYHNGEFRKLAEIEVEEAAKTANNYLSSDSTGIMVADMTDGNRYTPSNVPDGIKNTHIDSTSFKVRDGQEVLASFGEESQIGKSDGWHQELSAEKTSFKNGDTEYAYISPDKIYSVNAEVTDAFYIGRYSIRNGSDGKLVIGLRR